MKASTVLLALPALAYAAATPAPAQVEERQIPGLPLPQLNCILGITGITECLPAGVELNPAVSCTLGGLGNTLPIPKN
ncbi:hypothetical protein F5X68DRAFT_237528 [Plectosphaerella plurivora]|uniref:Uncharacterized protein n=1 Tax=Plectosphaerella plurivora TaxID=936078 RepID=A0A9P8V0U1_9PEZI|nr:hypothetical protein F5X68DRAFT_237528 [Plectosphaerella plurivora]